MNAFLVITIALSLLISTICLPPGLHGPAEVKELRNAKVRFISCGDEHTAVLTEVHVRVIVCLPSEINTEVGGGAILHD